jgi:hypothetical protein
MNANKNRFSAFIFLPLKRRRCGDKQNSEIKSQTLESIKEKQNERYAIQNLPEDEFCCITGQPGMQISREDDPKLGELL